MTINEFLNNEKLGELAECDIIHAYGITKEKILVWLPQINDNEYWINIVLPNDGIIVQLSKKEIKNKKEPDWDPAVVITRNKDDPKDEFKRLPDKYRPVYRNENILLTIHAKKDLPIAQGDVKNKGNISWIEGFANTVEEAIEKEKLFRKKARLQ